MSELGKFDDYFFSITRLPEPLLFNALSQKVGLLTPFATIGVVRFYQRIEEARSWIPLLRDDPEGKVIFSPVSVLRPLCQAVEESMLTLLIMQGEMKAENIQDAKVEELDVKDAQAVIDENDQFWEDRKRPSELGS